MWHASVHKQWVMLASLAICSAASDSARFLRGRMPDNIWSLGFRAPTPSTFGIEVWGSCVTLQTLKASRALNRKLPTRASPHGAPDFETFNIRCSKGNTRHVRIEVRINQPMSMDTMLTLMPVPMQNTVKMLKKKRKG